MGAFEAFVTTELPRRSPHLTKAITGYDADPNLGGAPAILQGSPVGTWFREETAARWWRRTETAWVIQDAQAVTNDIDGGDYSDLYLNTADIDGGSY